MTHDDLVESVARALLPGYDAADDRFQKAAIGQARAAIAAVYEAIRDPDEVQSVEGGLAAERAMFEKQVSVFDGAADCYRAMLDASPLKPR